MDPTTVFCPNLTCPTRGLAGEGNGRIHSRKDHRFLCTACHKTFAATKGAVCTARRGRRRAPHCGWPARTCRDPQVALAR